MFERVPRIERLEFEPGRRILVVSDIHANLPYFRGALEKAAFCAKDELIIDGDFLEKGQQSLETLRFIMELCELGNVHPILGNCDAHWTEDVFSDLPDFDDHVLHYMKHKQYGVLWEMCAAAGLDVMSMQSFTPHKETLKRLFPRELSFLHGLPHAIETDNFIFAHAGIDGSKPLSEHSTSELMHRDAFLHEGQSFDKWVIVGHWPVVLYGENVVCANPIIDRARKIASIDGGCVLKDDGQLNVLVIPDRDSDEFTWVSYDPLPEKRVLRGQSGSTCSYYIRWGDSRVRVLERGEEFSRCRHVRTGYEMDILTKYLFRAGDETDCNDSTDYVLPLRAGDAVRVVEETSRGYLVKHNGVSGWYFGELE